MTRSRRETVTFRHPFRINGIDRQLQAGAYEVVTDEELIEGLSFPCFRRVATLIMVPGAPPHHQFYRSRRCAAGRRGRIAMNAHPGSIETTRCVQN